MDKFTYRGKSVQVELNKAGDRATVTVEGKPFKAILRTEGKPGDNYIKLWMCEGAYSMAESPAAMARHIIEYWHQFNEEEGK